MAASCMVWSILNADKSTQVGQSITAGVCRILIFAEETFSQEGLIHALDMGHGSEDTNV